MDSESPIREGQVLSGPLFNEPMRVETVRTNGASTWEAGLVGQQSELFDEVRKERLPEHDHVAEHVELSLTEVLQRLDQEIGRAAEDVEKQVPGAEGRQAQAEFRHDEALARRDRRRQELDYRESNVWPASWSCPTRKLIPRKCGACDPMPRPK